ncbi:MAG: PIN domain-containing protein [Candidatus Bathyarchaeota archaeon]|nr:PIN domain-containing protein [Candidatus Bathyarchaeota archaeon]
MSCNYIIDAYAWIEYFKASKQGEIAKEFIENEHAITPTIVVSEISRKLSQQIQLGKETREGSAKLLDFIRDTTRIVDLDFETAAEVGKIIQELKSRTKDWSLADLIILCTARGLSGKVVTGDEHFHKLNDTIFIKE